MTPAVVGLVMVGVRIRTAPPSRRMRSSAAMISRSTSAHVLRWPRRVGYASRRLSYRPSSEACPTAHVAPPESG